MRMMLKVVMPVEKSNQAIQNGMLPKVMMGAMQEFKPEAAYFYPENGKRASLMVFDMKDPSQIPLIAERFFVELHAEGLGRNRLLLVVTVGLNAPCL